MSDVNGPLARATDPNSPQPLQFDTVNVLHRTRYVNFMKYLAAKLDSHLHPTLTYYELAYDSRL